MTRPTRARTSPTASRPSIPWSTLEDAYGPATDLPDDLQGLASAVPRTRKAALDALWARLCHQGSVYEASVAAVPYLVTLVSNPRARGRAGVLELLAGLAVGDHRTFLDGSLSAFVRKRPKRSGEASRTVEARCHAAVSAAAPTVRSLLNDPEAEVRAAAAFVLAWLPDRVGASSDAIAARYRKEPDAAARVSMLLALGHLGARTQRPTLERTLAEETAPSSVQAAAAIGLVYLDRTRVPSAAGEVLEAAAVAPGLRKTAQPWNDGDLAGHAAGVLATLPTRRQGRSEAIARLNRVGYLAGDKLAGDLIRKTFSGRNPKSATTLTGDQRELLATILRVGLTRFKGYVEVALRLRGLPPLKELPKFVGVTPGRHWELRRAR